MTSCTFCKSPAPSLLSCPCAKASYCGKECQVSDWKRHKPDCPPFIVKEVPGKGRGLIATRSLPLGFTVLDEQPVLVMDHKKPDYDKLLTDFKIKNKETREEILKLRHDPRNAAALTNDKELVAKLVSIFRYNAANISKDGKVCKGLYLKQPLLNHSCRSNVSIWGTTEWTEEKIPSLVGKLLRKVEKGEELTKSYFKLSGHNIDDDGCLTKEQRKEKLVQREIGNCLCEICKEENVEDENLRKEFQEMKTQEEPLDVPKMLYQAKYGTEFEKSRFKDLLAIAKRKVEIAKVVDGHAVFQPLVQCWQLSELVAAGKKDQKAREQAAQYKKEVDVWAQILGPKFIELKMHLEQQQMAAQMTLSMC